MAYSFNSPGKTWDRVCPRCGKEFSASHVGTKYCSDCRDVHKIEAVAAHRERMRALREERKARGVCIRCGDLDERTLSGHVLCEVCAEKSAGSSAKVYKNRKKNGLCGICGRPAEPGYNTCQICRDRVCGWQQARKAENRCEVCGKSDDLTKAGKSLCKECAIKRSAYDSNRYDLRVMKRACPICGDPLPADWYYVHCPKCRENLRYYYRRNSDALCATE